MLEEIGLGAKRLQFCEKYLPTVIAASGLSPILIGVNGSVIVRENTKYNATKRSVQI